MPRPRTARPKSVYVPIRLTEDEAQALDALRTGLSRSAYLRLLIRNARRDGSVDRTPLTPPAAVPRQPDDPVHPVSTEQKPSVPPPDQPHQGSISHYHDRKGEEETQWKAGREYTRNRCSICGQWGGWR